MATTVPVYLRLGSEFMPPLYEGSLLYMPTTLPGISVTEAQRLLQTQDKILHAFPEVETVFGKAGRAETSTDPAPFSMMETTVVLKPESPVAQGAALVLVVGARLAQAPAALDLARPHLARGAGRRDGSRAAHPRHDQRVDHADQEPHRHAVDGHPHAGGHQDLRIGRQARSSASAPSSSASSRAVPGTRSVFAERTAGGYFLDFELKRDALARYGLTVDDANAVVTVGDRRRRRHDDDRGPRSASACNVRYPRELRDTPAQPRARARHAAVGRADPAGAGRRHCGCTSGPAMIRDENALLAGYVYVDFDTAGRDVGGYVDDAKRAVAQKLAPTPGYTLSWSGQFENMTRVRERMKLVVPLTLFLIFLLLYMNTQSAVKALIVMLAVPFSLVGAVWLLFALGYNVSIAVWVGMIALMGLDAETGVFMLLFLDLALRRGRARRGDARPGRARRGDHPRRGQARAAQGDDRHAPRSWA